MRTKLLVILCSLAMVFCSGCQLKDKINKDEDLTQEQQQVDLEVLREEYGTIVQMIDEMLFVLSSEEVNIQTTIEMVLDIQRNMIKPTQPQTIELVDKIDELANLSISYMLVEDETKKAELENEMVIIFDEIEDIMIEIEQLLVPYNAV